MIDEDLLQPLWADLFQNPDSVDGARFKVRDDGFWRRLMRKLSFLRIVPFWGFNLNRCGVELPTFVQDRIKAEMRRTALRSLELWRELVYLDRLLTKLEIDVLVLKGGALAFSVYPSPSLRPMRDLDIWVDFAQLRPLVQALRSAGYHIADYPESPGDASSGCYEVDCYSPRSRLRIELHSGAMRYLARGKESGADLQNRVVSRRVPFDSKLSRVYQMSPEDTLLHLISHGVIDHQLDNGPVLLLDLWMVLEAYTIDWAKFWSLSRELDNQLAAILALSLVERCLNRNDLIPTEHRHFIPTEPQLNQAQCLMLRDYRNSSDNDFWITWDHALTLKSKLKFIFQKISRSAPRRSAVIYNTSSGNVRGSSFGWVLKRIRRLFGSYSSATAKQERRYLDSLSTWLSVSSHSLNK
jgi:Uncharacterised nucleotidyltransferase